MFLRIALAVIFIWAGLGKIMARMPVDAAQVATLSSMGIRVEGLSALVPDPVPPAPTAPGEQLPPALPDDAPTEPAPDSSDDSGHAPVALPPAARAVRLDSSAPTRQDEQRDPGTPADPAGQTEQPAQPGADPSPASSQPAAPGAPAASAPAAAVDKGPTVRRVWGLALLIHRAAHPGVDDSGKQLMPLWPRAIGEGNWPRYFAIAVVVAELLGGFLVAIGFLTRFGAFLLVGVMLGAIWLDQIGPAIQSGKTVLLILPAHAPWDVKAWQPLLFQLSVLCSALALMFLGAGAPSLDRALGWFRRGGDNDDL